MVPLARTLFSTRKFHRVLLLAGLALCSSASAQQAVTGSLANAARAPATAKPTSIFDQIWGSAVLYKAESGVLTSFAFQGLLHLQDDQGWSDRGDLQTSFDLQDADEGRK